MESIHFRLKLIYIEEPKAQKIFYRPIQIFNGIGRKLEFFEERDLGNPSILQEILPDDRNFEYNIDLSHLKWNVKDDRWFLP